MFINAKELLPKEDEIFDDSSETISFFQTKLTESLNRLQEKDILILDFRELDIPRLRTFDKGFGRIYEKKRIVPIVLVNVKHAGDLQESVMENTLFNANTVLPIISRSGDIFWIGVKDESLETICNLLFEGITIREITIDSSIDPFLKRNSWLLSFNKRKLFNKMSEEFDKYLRDKIFHELNIIRKAHYLLPSGEHCKVAFDTQHILTDSELIKDIAFEICRRIKEAKIEVILCHSLLATFIGKEIAEILGIDHFTALGYPFPICHFENKIYKHRVLILSTVIRSGTSVRNLQDYIKQKGGEIGKVITILDTRNLSHQEIETEALVSYPIEPIPEEECLLCKEGKPLESIDYFTGVPIPVSEEEHLPSLLGDEEFWEMVIDAGALREGHLQVNGHHFSLFIETYKIFKNDFYASELSNKLLDHFGLKFDVVLHPLNQGAILFAKKLVDLINTKKMKGEDKSTVIPIYKKIETNDFVIPDIHREKIDGKDVLIIDDGANFGTTMLGMHFAVAKYNPKTTKHAVFLNRLGKTYRKILSTVLHENEDKYELISLYCLHASPVYRPWECPMCNKLRGLSARKQLRTYLSEEAQKKISDEIEQLRPISIYEEILSGELI